MIFWILATPRSGSNFFTGEIWRRLGGVPKGMEFLSESILRRQTDYIPNPDAPFRSYLDHLMAREAMNGVLAVKLMWRQVEVCCKYPDFIPQMKGRKIIFLRRRDIIRQGISFYLAAQTGKWTSSGKSQLMQPDEVPYDFESIAQFMRRTDNDNAQIGRFLQAFDLDSRIVYYEDFTDNPDGESNSVLSYLGLSPATGPIPAKKLFNRQSTTLNDDFYEHFVADVRARLCEDGSFRGAPLFSATR